MQTLTLPDRKYPSPECCIFCLAAKGDTVEHVIPRSLCKDGEIQFLDGSCSACNGEMNARFESIALGADFKTARFLLELKRRRRGRKGKALEVPPVALGNHTVGSGSFDVNLSAQEYPNSFALIQFEPAGKISGVDRGGALGWIRIGIVNLGRRPSEVNNVTTREAHNHTAFSLTIAKMAYSFAAGELGLDAFDGSEIRDLLKGRREDVYNFVGGLSRSEHYAKRHLHALYVKRRGDLVTVVVHLFASFGFTPYEVVVGRHMT